MLNAPVIFSADNLKMSYGKQILLDDTELTVHRGEKIGLVGRNGCGKSTFMKIHYDFHPKWVIKSQQNAT